MKNHFFLLIIVSLILASCSSPMHESLGSLSTRDSSSVDPGSSSGSNPGIPAGKITAGEWNDLKDWDFWKEILKKDDFKGMPANWGIFPNHRVSVRLIDQNGAPMVDSEVTLDLQGEELWSARTNFDGSAELWVDLFDAGYASEIEYMSLSVNGNLLTDQPLQYFEDGTIQIVMPTSTQPDQIADLCFVVDATGSMGDELLFLQSELEDVINRSQDLHPGISIRTGSVFYRDKGDNYVTRESNFSTNIGKTLKFIRKQEAGGGGDFPEAVHSALDEALNKLDWSASAQSRILFLLLDAPPHDEPQIMREYREYIQLAAEKGVRIIPISASGIDKPTEFLLRFSAIITNGTYVFITDHSGIGDDHLEPTVGEFDVEYLNDLMVRLIDESLN